MGFVIDLSREIDAPPPVVWDVVTNLAAYPEWNPFVVACRSGLKAGDPIVMQVRLFPWFTQSQTEAVFEHVPQARLCYGLTGGRAGAIVSRRCHEIAAGTAGRTHYRSRFELSGWFSPVVAAMLGSRLEHGFRSMTDALQKRAEQRRT